MRNLLIIAFSLCSLFMSAQQVTIDGYVFENGNRGFLNTVLVKAFDHNGNFLNETFSDVEGHFLLEVEAGTSYKLVSSKDMFHDKEVVLERKASANKVFAKVEMKRAPGYLFEITLANKRDDESTPVDAIKGADIEVYNNTTKKMILNLKDYPNPNFEVPLLKENHYTLYVRKKGYLTKRMEAFVNVEGCILCFEGIGEVRPGVSDNLTEGNETGVLLANVELEAVYEGKELQIPNLYYQTASAEITKEAAGILDNLISILKDNPNLKVELGSHTDSRGADDLNMDLSQRRAKSAVDYITTNSDISKEILRYRGYGEEKLLAKCSPCTEAEHAQNRRTEITILGIDPSIDLISLADRIKADEQEALIWELMNQEQVKVGDNEKPPFLEDGDQGDDSSSDHVDEIIEIDSSPVVKEEKSMIDQDASSMESATAEIVKQANTGEEPYLGASYYSIIYYFSRKALDPGHDVWGLQGCVEYQTASGDFLYHIGQFKDEKEAMKFMKEEVKPQFAGAYVTLFENGKIIIGE